MTNNEQAKIYVISAIEILQQIARDCDEEEVNYEDTFKEITSIIKGLKIAETLLEV